MHGTSSVGWWIVLLIAAYLVTRLVSAAAGEPSSVGVPAIDQVFQRVAPSVVAIKARGRNPMSGGEGRFVERGSGVLISREGTVLTAAYVVHGMDEISVTFPGGQTVSARVVASEPATADLSLLQLDRVPAGSTVSTLADSDTVKVGDNVFIVGAPTRLSHSLSPGSIRARWAPNTAYRTMPVAEFFQTDATVDTDNSGGPMFNVRGEVIGIVSRNISAADRDDRHAFVVTLNTARRLLLEKRTASTTTEDSKCPKPQPLHCQASRLGQPRRRRVSGRIGPHMRAIGSAFCGPARHRSMRPKSHSGLRDGLGHSPRNPLVGAPAGEP